MPRQVDQALTLAVVALVLLGLEGMEERYMSKADECACGKLIDAVPFEAEIFVPQTRFGVGKHGE